MSERTKSKGGRKRQFKNNVEFRAYCREKVKAGYINSASGGWIRLDDSLASHRHVKFGYGV
jgi:hypothetical protein